MYIDRFQYTKVEIKINVKKEEQQPTTMLYPSSYTPKEIKQDGSPIMLIKKIL